MTDKVGQIKQYAKQIRDIPLTKVGLAEDPESLAAGFTAEEAVGRLTGTDNFDNQRKNKFLVEFREQ